MSGADKARGDEERLVREVAGLVSTVEFRPSWNHPERCLPIAEQIVRHLKAEAPPPEPSVGKSVSPKATETQADNIDWLMRHGWKSGMLAPEPSAASGPSNPLIRKALNRIERDGRWSDRWRVALTKIRDDGICSCREGMHDRGDADCSLSIATKALEWGPDV